jgi:uncharacterized protein
MTQFFLRKFLFRPVPLTPDAAFQFDAPFEELWLDTPDGERLNALFFPAPAQPARGAVLYFHGNRDNLQRWGAMHRDFTALGYDFLVPDYRGYGKSSGEPDEQGFYEDSMLMFRWLAQRCAPERIVLYGRSLGSGVACWLAARAPARMLLLETPFDSVAGLVAAHLRRERLSFEPAPRFPNDEHLRQTTMPVLIFHGTRDRVVPYACAAKLKSVLKPGDVFVTIEGGSHNNLGLFEQYRAGLRERLG